MQYTDKVREYALQMPIEEAVEQAVVECIKEDILAEFLRKNRAEAMEVSIFEYNEEMHLANLRREGYEEGIQQGMVRLIIELLQDLGEIPDSLRIVIESQQDMDVLSKWNKLAAKSTTMKEFEDAM